MNEPNLDPLVRRLDALETTNASLRRTNRRLMGLAVLAVSGVALMAFCSTQRAAEAGQPKVVEGDEFVLNDKDHKPRAVLKTRDDGSPVFTMLDKEGKPRLGFSLTAEGIPSLALIDHNAKVRVGLALSKLGGGGVHLNDKDGKIEISMDEGRIGTSPNIHIVHPKSEKGDVFAAELSLEPGTGNASLVLCTADLKNGGATLDTNQLCVGGNIGAPFWFLTKDHPILVMSDKNAKVKGSFGLDKDDNLILNDADGKVALPKGTK